MTWGSPSSNAWGSPTGSPGSGGGGGGPTTTLIWSVDFSTVADHDFKSTSTLALSGVTFTAENQANQDRFEVAGGILLIEGGESGGYNGSNFLGPQLACDWADLMAYSAGDAYDPEMTYVWRMIMTADSPQPSNSGYEGPFCGIRRNRAVVGMDCHIGVYQANYRAAKGKSTERDNARGNTNVSNPRSFAVKYGQAGASWLVSASDLSGQPPFAGTPINAGYMQNDLNSTGIGITPVPDSLDLSNASSQAYIGCISKVGGSTFQYSKLELHEVG